MTKLATDPSTISTYQELSREIRDRFTRDLSLSALYIDCSNISNIEKHNGKETYSDVMKKIHQIFMEMKGKEIRQEDIIVSNAKGSDEFIIFLGKKRDENDFYPSDLEKVCERVTGHLNDKIFPVTFPYLRGRPKISIGYGVILHNPLMREEKLLSKLIDDAKKMAEYQTLKRQMRNKEKLQELIIKQDIRTVFQPIVDLTKNQVMGYEALSRGPEGTEYEAPLVLFDAAQEAELIFELDRLCRNNALQQAKGINPKHKLFLNCMLSAVLDPLFKGTYLEALLEDIQLKPMNIVLEVTEREAIEDYELFRKAVKYYSSFGFSIAMDDTGSGYSSLESLVELKPHFIKLDISIVRDLDKNLLKKELVKAIGGLASQMNSTIIAEGIETEAELLTLREIGVNVGQGYLFAKPGPAFPTIMER